MRASPTRSSGPSASSTKGWSLPPPSRGRSAAFASGLEALTGTEWALLEALAARTEVTVSLPYEPGRPVFAALGRTAEDLAGLAAGAVAELPPRYADVAPPALAHLERALFADRPGESPALDGVIRFFEGAGSRGTL